jgi:hypothetical protein
MPTTSKQIGIVTARSAETIVARIDGLETFEGEKANLQVGRYLKIAEGNTDFVIAVIRNVKGTSAQMEGKLVWTFDVECQPVGTLVNGTEFSRGSTLLPVPLEPVFSVGRDTLDLIFAASARFNHALAPLSMNKEIDLMIDGNGFFGKHVAIVGSTGSGKSSTVARILQDIVGIDNGSNLHIEAQRNSHIVIFDIHAEYRRAFELDKEQAFTLNVLDVDTLALPYWLMNAEELESLFIESNEQNSYNQVSQFKHAVIANKERHNPSVRDMTYDCPVYFSIDEVHRFIENVNREVISKLKGEEKPKLADKTLVENREDLYFDKLLDFVPSTNATLDKASNGPFHGEFNRFSSRLQTTLADKRLNFLLRPMREDGKPYATADFEEIIKQFLGYINKSNVTIIDLSGIPFEVMSIVVSLVSRLVFDFCFHYSKLRHVEGGLNDVPVMVVCEEAHNYVPQSDIAAYKSSRKSIERIAKEGRKEIWPESDDRQSETIGSFRNHLCTMQQFHISSTDQQQ